MDFIYARWIWFFGIVDVQRFIDDFHLSVQIILIDWSCWFNINILLLLNRKCFEWIMKFYHREYI